MPDASLQALTRAPRSLHASLLAPPVPALAPSVARRLVGPAAPHGVQLRLELRDLALHPRELRIDLGLLLSSVELPHEAQVCSVDVGKTPRDVQALSALSLWAEQFDLRLGGLAYLVHAPPDGLAPVHRQVAADGVVIAEIPQRYVSHGLHEACGIASWWSLSLGGRQRRRAGVAPGGLLVSITAAWTQALPEARGVVREALRDAGHEACQQR
mmetsp:Transcript_15518/g.44459  ORF Transcript_15518/g.44459 Transcript_15518/m.44459 type:complete len:213 (+) Transcript_15518:33-671(+)